MDDSDKRELELRTDILNQMRTIQGERDQLIRKVLTGGATVAEVMAVTGLTRARVYQIKGS